jgi:hypothetical protein
VKLQLAAEDAWYCRRCDLYACCSTKHNIPDMAETARFRSLDGCSSPVPVSVHRNVDHLVTELVQHRGPQRVGAQSVKNSRLESSISSVDVTVTCVQNMSPTKYRDLESRSVLCTYGDVGNVSGLPIPAFMKHYFPQQPVSTAVRSTQLNTLAGSLANSPCSHWPLIVVASGKFVPSLHTLA